MMVRVNIEITFSKVMALLMLMASTTVDLVNESVVVLAVALPVIASLILSKQYNDRKKLDNPSTTQNESEREK